MQSLTKNFRIHLTNISGAGATELALSLLPAIERNKFSDVTNLYLPSVGPLSQFVTKNARTKATIYKRWLPNGLSRFLECTVLGRKFSGNSPLLVLGDLPIRCVCPQIVLVHTTHLCISDRILIRRFKLKYLIASWLFKINCNRVSMFIVQTEEMKAKLQAKYSITSSRITILPQPVPVWLNLAQIRRDRRISLKAKLTLFYPAAFYPHKNHKLLSKLGSPYSRVIDEIVLTVDPSINPAPNLSFVNCVGFLPASGVIEKYRTTDGLLFLSSEESYGFPLVEAMFIGLPIICPNLPYAKVLCGDQAIYFDSSDPNSLGRAIEVLKIKLENGWWPDWSEQILSIPMSWDEAARDFINVTTKTIK